MKLRVDCIVCIYNAPERGQHGKRETVQQDHRSREHRADQHGEHGTD